jgi:NADH-quinone oxidoreductase subunit L
MAYSPVVGWIMTVIAAMTAFYMFRLYYGIFWGTENKELHAHHTPHEAPLTMTLPLMFLAVVTVGAGFIPFGHFVSADGQAYDIHLDPTIATTSVIVAVCSIALATFIYKGEKQPVAEKMRAALPALHRWAFKRFYLDEVYQFVTHRIIFAHISKPIAWFDRHVVDGFFDFLAWGTNALGVQIKGLQSGSIQKYAYVFLLGVLILLLIVLI